MRIGMRLLLGYFLLVAVAAWFVLAIFVKEVKPGVRRATEGTLIDTATLLAELARPDLLSGDPTHGQLAQAFNQLQHRPFRANIGGINKVRNEYHVYMTDSQHSRNLADTGYRESIKRQRYANSRCGISPYGL